MLRTTLRSLRAHKRRLLSTTVAVLLGVAFMTGTMVLGDTMDRSFDDLFSDLGAEVDAQVRGPELFDPGFGAVRAPLDEALVAAVEQVDGVAAAAGFTQTAGGRVLGRDGEPLGPDDGPPTLLTSWVDDPQLAGIEVVEGRGPRSEDEVALNLGAAEDGDLVVGGPVDLVVPEGRRTFTLVGTYRVAGRDSAGGAITVDLLPAVVQRLAGQPGQVQAILVRGEGGAGQEELAARLDAALPTSVEVVTGEQAAEEQADAISSGLSFLTTFLLVFAFIALVVGAFIIYNTFSILVAQRGRELALLRALGASRRQVLGSVLVEAAVVGVVASVLGLAAGIALALGLQRLLGGLGLDLPAEITTVTGGTVATALLVGVLVTCASAVVPARRATRVPPIAALRDVAHEGPGTSRVRVALGVVLLVLAALSALPAFGEAPGERAVQSVGLGALLLLVATLVPGPVLARPLARLLGAPLPRLRGTAGALARENAARNPKRTASTAAALMIGVALVGFITVLATSARAAVDAGLTRGFRGELVIQSQAFDLGIPTDLAGRIAALDQVAAVAPVRQGPGRVELPGGEGRDVFLSATDPARYLAVFDLPMVAGDFADLGPGGIVVDQRLVRDAGLALGDRLSVLFPTGSTAELEVVAISDDPLLLGSYTLSLQDWEAGVGARGDTLLFVDAQPGADAGALLARVRELAAVYPTVDVQDREGFLGDIADTFDQVLNIVYGLLALSVLIALIGIANTLSLSIHERTRELGLLRAVGMTRGQLRATIRWEAAIIALIGTALGLLLGVVLSYVLVRALASQGLDRYEVPVTSLAVIVAVFAALGVVASALPARRAARLDVLDAIARD